MKSIRKSLVFSFVERYSSLIISILSTVVLSRMLSPVEIGIFSVASALINIAQSMREFGANSFILQLREATKENIAAATGISLSIGVILALTFFLSANRIAMFYGDPELSIVVRVLSANFIVVAFASISAAQLQRDMKFRTIMYGSLSGNIANAIVSITLSGLKFGAISLAWGSLANVAVVVICNYRALGAAAFVRPTLRNSAGMIRFGAYSSATAFLLEVVERTPDLVVGRLVSLEGTGMFSRGNGLITLFRAALTQAVDPVIASGFAALHRDRHDAREPFLRVISYLTAVGWPALSILGLLAYPIIIIMFGHQWGAAVGVAQILCVAAAVALIGNVCQTYQAATGAVRANFFVQIVSVPIFVSSVALGARHSLEGAALGAAVAGAVMTLLSLTMLRGRLGLTWSELARTVLPSLMLTAITVLPAIAIIELLGSEAVLPTGLLGGGGAALAWVAGIFLLRHPLRSEVRLAFDVVGRRFHLIFGV